MEGIQEWALSTTIMVGANNDKHLNLGTWEARCGERYVGNFRIYYHLISQLGVDFRIALVSMALYSIIRLHGANSHSFLCAGSKKMEKEAAMVLFQVASQTTQQIQRIFH